MNQPQWNASRFCFARLVLVMHIGKYVHTGAMRLERIRVAVVEVVGIQVLNDVADAFLMA